jgi:predicted ATPase
MGLAAGTSVDRYVVEHLLGQGGAAEVYCVRHRQLDSRHALKVLSSPSPALAARLLKEGRAQSRLQHPHLLPVRDILDLHGRPALLMPLVQGPSLASLLAVRRPTEAEALALFRCVVDGLAFAHARGVVHRDLKPANVLLEVRHGLLWPLVADFGLVKLEDDDGDATRAGATFGTPAYAAPEQLRDASRATARADLFSLGVLLAELLTGARPFAGTRVAEIVDAHRLPPRLDGVREPLRGLVEDLLRIDPAARPPCCEAVLARLPAAVDADRAGAALIEAMQRASERPLVTQGAETTLPPASPRHNLAPPRDRFVGREAELSALRRQLGEGRRLLTLVGTGGIGKSRLALELARATLQDWPGGVWFCELAEARTAKGIVTAMATALDLPLGKDPETQIADALLGRGPALFLLDNFEQIAAFAPQTVGRWLDRAPEARFVVTSREPLRLRGERVVPLDVLDEEEALALFAERARAADDRFDAAGDEAAVRTLVALLDRLPLAIELAAARTRVWSVAELSARMARRFQVLTSRSPDLPPRQRTMEAALEWSWELLEPDERAVLAQCSVFEGGFAPAVAEAVIAVEGERWVDEVLAALVDKSLLVSRKGRLSLLASVQAFAREKLADARAVEERHVRWFARMGAEAAVEALHRSGGVERGWALWADRENLVVAARRALARGEAEVAIGCALAAAEVFEARGPLSEGPELLAAVLAADGVAALGRSPATASAAPAPEVDAVVRLTHKHGVLLRVAGRTAQAEEALRGALDLDRRANGGRRRAALLVDCGGLHREQGRMEAALEHLTEALDGLRRTGDRRREAWALLHLGILHFEQSRLEEAVRHYQEALALARAVGDRKVEGRVLGNLGNVHREAGRMELALGFLEQALTLFEQVGDRRSEGVLFGNRSALYFELGRMDVARTDIERALAVCREIGDRRFEALALVHRGNQHRRQGRTGEALSDYEQALAIHREIGDRLFEGIVLANLGALHQGRGRLDEALRCLGDALALFVDVGHTAYEGFVLNEIGDVHLELGRLEEAQGHQRRALALHRGNGDRKKEGLVLGSLGVWCLHHGRLEEARGHLDEAIAIHREAEDRACEARALGDRGDLDRAAGALDDARRRYEEALRIARSLGDRRREGILLGALGRAHAEAGDVPRGRATLAEAEALTRSVGDRLALATVLCHLATLEAGDRPETARVALDEARALADAMGVGPASPLGGALAAAEQRPATPRPCAETH